MSLQKKIALSFLISSAIIALLAAFDFLSFREIKKEILYLEITDTISRKSLQLRRHEKNYFLYGAEKAGEEASAVRSYLVELQTLLLQNPNIDQTDKLQLRSSIVDYERRFGNIQIEAMRLAALFQKVKKSDPNNAKYFAVVESTFLERPSQSADFLERIFFLPHNHALVGGLRKLDGDITALRKTGEDILVISKDLDKIAREKAETVIRVSQTAILIIFPLFFVIGIGSLFLISTNMAKRLMLLIKTVEKTGKGSYPHLTDTSARKAHDEVGVLIDKFNDMEDQLALWETELERKNKELMQIRKLAAIGTLASGVAHELNNPLNNIYLSAQMLSREAGGACSSEVKEAITDIVGQTERVKRIVEDLLEFARGREPQLRETDLAELIRSAYRRTGGSRNTQKIAFTLKSPPAPLMIPLDQGQMEQVFNNLFTNAVDSMEGRGELSVIVKKTDEVVEITISDTGKGIPDQSLHKIFEPFFTTKDKGTGLGLAIVYNIIKKHYGDIGVESIEGKGTTFKIMLPAEKI